MDQKSTGGRPFSPVSAPGLSEEARKALVGAFDAMAAWRSDLMAASERGGERAFDKMAQAAKAMGWPAQLIDSTREQLQGVAKMQVQMIDQMMDAWEEQVKSPNPMGAFPTAMMGKLQSLPGMSAFPGFPPMPGMDAFAGMANPMQFWMQLGEQWQKNWAQAMQMWANGANLPGSNGKRTW